MTVLLMAALVKKLSNNIRDFPLSYYYEYRNEGQTYFNDKPIHTKRGEQWDYADFDPLRYCYASIGWSSFVKIADEQRKPFFILWLHLFHENFLISEK